MPWRQEPLLVEYTHRILLVDNFPHSWAHFEMQGIDNFNDYAKKTQKTSSFRRLTVRFERFLRVICATSVVGKSVFKDGCKVSHTQMVIFNSDKEHVSMVSCQKGPTRHAYAWQIGPFWQDTLDIWLGALCFHCYRWWFIICLLPSYHQNQYMHYGIIS